MTIFFGNAATRWRSRCTVRRRRLPTWLPRTTTRERGEAAWVAFVDTFMYEARCRIGLSPWKMILVGHGCIPMPI